MKTICLVTSAHIAYNPRLLKEADALTEAGYDVRVVAMSLEKEKACMDEALMRSRRWRLTTLNARKSSLAGRMRWLLTGAQHRRRQKHWERNPSPASAARTFSRHLPGLAATAGQEAADLFIAHNLPALPAAARAAAKFGAKLGFDAEDFHRGEFPDVEQDSRPARLTRIVEEQYLPQCAHLTAASDGIAEAYAGVLKIRRPVTILNAFPLEERRGKTPQADLASERCHPGLSLYWYSQTIGPDRGLNDALEAIALAGTGIALHLRGRWAAGYEETFWKKAQTLGIAGRAFILPTAPPEQLVERAAQHDIGLALEPGDRINNRLATSNKLLVYFLAGLAIAATDVPGQRAVMNGAREGGLLFKPGDARALANQLRIWRDQPEVLSRTKAVARALGESRFCWDVEKHRLLQAVASLWI